jgi:hypothetical protein
VVFGTAPSSVPPCRVDVDVCDCDGTAGRNVRYGVLRMNLNTDTIMGR